MYELTRLEINEISGGNINSNNTATNTTHHASNTLHVTGIIIMASYSCLYVFAMICALSLGVIKVCGGGGNNDNHDYFNAVYP